MVASAIFCVLLGRSHEGNRHLAELRMPSIQTVHVMIKQHGRPDTMSSAPQEILSSSGHLTVQHLPPYGRL